MKKSGVIQCHRCQRLHHTTGQCNFNYRCVQCTSPHIRGECPRLTNPNLPIGCVNCAEAKLDFKNHTANDLRNCKYYDNSVEKRQQQSRQQHQQRPKQQSTTNNIDAESFNINPNSRHEGTNGQPRANYSDVVRSDNNGNKKFGGLSTAQIAEIVAITVQSVISRLNDGA